MTEEQIKQNAYDYTYNSDHNWTWDDSGESRVDISAEVTDAHIAGAHSRDEEIESLQRRVSLWKHEAEVAAKELNQLRNPWINASKQLPPEDKEGSDLSIDCLVMAGDGNSFFYVIAWYDYRGRCWYEKYDFDQTHLDGNKVFYWMKLPKCNHIEVEGGDK